VIRLALQLLFLVAGLILAVSGLLVAAVLAFACVVILLVNSEAARL
jgi:ABC-type lipoprotein release transport system permease subunit